MSTQTTNLHLVKPTTSEPVDISVLNSNFESIDEGFGELETSILGPVGTIMTTVRTDLTNDWLLCNGETIDNTEYPDLVDMLREVSDLPIGLLHDSIAFDANVSFKAVVYGHGYYVACGRRSSYPCIAYALSLLGPWTIVQLDNTNSYYPNDIVYDEITDTFVICGYKYGSSTSDEYPYIWYISGVPTGRWTTLRLSGSATCLTQIKKFKNYFVAIGSGYYNTIALYYATSPSGTWTRYEITQDSGLYIAPEFMEMACSSDYLSFIYTISASGQYNCQLVYTTDLSTWTYKTLYQDSTPGYYRYKYLNGKFVLIRTPSGNTTYIISSASTPVDTFTQNASIASTDTTNSPKAMLYISGYYIIVNSHDLVTDWQFCSTLNGTWITYTTTGYINSLSEIDTTLVLNRSSGSVTYINISTPIIATDGAYNYIKGR